MVEVTGFNVSGNLKLSVLELVDSNDCIYIVDIQSIDVIDRWILDNVGGRRPAWKRSIPLCKSRHFVHLVFYHHLQ